METNKITEGGMLCALQIVLGLFLIPLGMGYGLYLQVLLPITVTLIYLKCGNKVCLIASINTFLLLMICFGNLAFAVYGVQALGFGYLTGVILSKRRPMQDDLMIESLIGCAFLLILDGMVAKGLGSSLLDYDGIDEMVLTLWPEANTSVVQIFYYLSIASVPVGSVLMTYVGSLLLGHRLRILQGQIKDKYTFLRQYKFLVPYAYHGEKSMRYALLGLGLNLFLWQYTKWVYLKVWIACSSAILLYFILMDFSKLIGQYILQRWKNPLWLMIYHFMLVWAFFKFFIWTCCTLIIIGGLVDGLTTIRQQQSRQLAIYIKRRIWS
ncbi:MAG: hypothetical protein E7231_15310 [Cellulosilyticum sp.]|nr:hypothetical protein [Cellulosilyticum sp.]